MKVGDYIVIQQGVHDERIPKDRRDGLVLEIAGKKKDQMFILFSNGEILKFHITQIQNLSL
jgi:hypothetical protein